LSVVIDSSVTVAWYFADERTAAVDEVLDLVTESGAIVPSLWRLEIANALQMAVRRGRIDTEFRDQSIADLALLNITTDPETGGFAWTTTLQLADRHRLTVYDAAYLELAQRLNLPLATLDRDLRSAAHGLGIPLLGAPAK
jgi:predicted nucleic acid-binding protein